MRASRASVKLSCIVLFTACALGQTASVNREDPSETAVRPALENWGKIDSNALNYAEVLKRIALGRDVELRRYPDTVRSEVEPLAAKALAIRERNPNTRATDLAFALELYAEVVRHSGPQGDADSYWRRAKAVRQKIIDQMFPAAPPKDSESLSQSGMVVKPPRVLYKIEPPYTEDARLFKHSATAMVRFVVGKDGATHSFQVLKNAGFGLDEQAVKALHEWRFQPAQEKANP
jgi:TonB family protein